MALPDISDREQLEAWLMTQPREVSLAIAARAALRVFPYMQGIALLKDPKNSGAAAIVLPLLRGMAVSWVAAKYPSHGNVLKASVAAVTAASDSAATSATAYGADENANYSAARAAFAAAASRATAPAYVASRAAHAASPAASVVSLAADPLQDCKFIDGGGMAKDLCNLPLWEKMIPEWVNQQWPVLQQDLLALNQDWEVWTRWYEAVLQGRPTPGGEALDVFRVTLNSEEDWEKGPAHVNGLIKAKEAELAGRERAPDAVGELVQRPSGYVFDIVDGRVMAKPVYGSVVDSSMAREFREAIATKAREAATRLKKTQCPDRFARSYDQLASFLDEVVDELPALAKLLMLSRTLDADGAALLSKSMRREYGGDVLSYVQDVLDSLEDYKALFPELLKIEAARMALKLTTGDAVQVNLHLTSISNEVAINSIVSVSATNVLNEDAYKIAELSTTIDQSTNSAEVEGAIEARANLVRGRTLQVRNFVARSLQAAGKGYDKGVEGAVEAVTKVGVVALIGAIGGKFIALAALVAMLRPLANKLEDNNKKPSPPGDIADV